MQGSCHCGKVRYEVTGTPLRFAHCHCDDCRKIHGTTFGSSILVQAGDFSVLEGQAEVTAYESSKGKFRCFCRHCGAHLYARMDYQPDVVIVRVGTLEDGHGLKPQMHIWVKAKAPWYEIRDDLTRYPEGFKP